MYTPDEIRSLVVAKGLALEPEVRGLSEEQVRRLESQVGRPFPRAYHDFLRAAGKGAGRYFAGTDMFSPDLAELREWAQSLLNAIDQQLPEDAVVFYVHQGYEFSFFLLSEGDDPPVYQFVEGEPRPGTQWRSFTAFIDDTVASYSSA